MAHDANGRNMMELLDMLEGHVADGRRFVFSNRIMVEEGEFMAIIDQLRESIPSEIQQARRVIQDRQEIILKAQEEAKGIIASALERQEYLVSQHGITAEARYRGEDTVREARERASRSMAAINDYARERLELVESVIRENLAEIERAKGNLSQA